jgi:hypothetical protein
MLPSKWAVLLSSKQYENSGTTICFLQMMIRTSSLQKEGDNNFYRRLPSSVIMSPPPQWVMERVTYNKCAQTQKMLQVLCLQVVIISMRFVEKNLPSRHFEEIAEEKNLPQT